MSSNTRPASNISTPQRRPHVAIGLAGLVIALLLPTLIVFVDETEFVLIERFGRIVAVYDQPTQRGLQFKRPWPIETVRRFDRRLQLLSPAGREAFTRDRKNVTVEAFVAWRIADGTGRATSLDRSPQSDRSPLLDRPVVRFFRSLGGVEVAEARLTSRLQSILTEQVGRAELTELLTASDSEAAPTEAAGPLEKLSADIQRELTQRGDEQDSLQERLGIEIVDVRIRRLNLPTGNMQAVFERMRSERQKIAERYRSAGLAENRMIRSQADRQAGELMAKASGEAERIRGAGDAAAIRILNEAYARDPEFAGVLQTLEAYKHILNERTTLVLSASNSLLKLLVDGVPAPHESPRPEQPSLSTPSTPSATEPINGSSTNKPSTSSAEASR